MGEANSIMGSTRKNICFGKGFIDIYGSKAHSNIDNNSRVKTRSPYVVQESFTSCPWGRFYEDKERFKCVAKKWVHVGAYAVFISGAYAVFISRVNLP